MAETKSESKKKEMPLGVGNILFLFFDKLNNNDYFKEKFKDTEVKILINTTDGKYAALVIINKGTISIESFPNANRNDLKKSVLGWDGKLEATTQFLRGLFTKNPPPVAMIKKMFTGKLRGPRKVMIIGKLFEILASEEK